MKRRVIAVAVATAALLALAAGAEAGEPPMRAKPTLSAEPPRKHVSDETRCGVCHTVQGWKDVKFNHDKTGFPLRGQHAQVTCQACHKKRFDDPVPTNCAGCHQDPHGGELGGRCASCHDELSWKSKFDAAAHRRTNFPLVGRHALIPCEECHLDQRDRGFIRAAVDCYSCHLADYQRTKSTGMDHLALGFPTLCRECHDAWRFKGASFAAHDACFEITGGPHAGIACLDCHTSLQNVSISGQCATGTAACTSCHTHACARTDQQHRDVPGYQCKDQKCYSCHRFTQGGSGLLKRKGLR